MSAVAVDLSTVPGAMERTISREVAGGLIEFEEAPKGWLTKKGEPRKAPWRAYHWTPAGEKRVRFPSTTQLLELIFGKPGIPPWAEARGIEGLLVALQTRQLDLNCTPEEAIEGVRRLKLGADAAKKEAADRGTLVHTALEEYMTTGAAPALAGRPEEHRGYIVALTNWLIDADPEPVSVETIVVSPEDGYAGRLDLRARPRKGLNTGALVTYDAKTQEKAAIYPGAHYQVALYERAAVICGEEPADCKKVVVFAADGQYREMPADHDDWRVDAALSHWRGSKPINSICESFNRAEREARR